MIFYSFHIQCKMSLYPIIFILHDADSSVITYKLHIIDNEKCSIILSKYSDITKIGNKNEIDEFGSAMINIFCFDNSNYQVHADIIKQYIDVDLAEEIGYLKEIDNNDINTMGLTHTYFVDFSNL